MNAGRLHFELGDPAAHSKRGIIVGSLGSRDNLYPLSSGWIPIGGDISSLIFLHALAKPASYVTGDNDIFDYLDAADLLGWYEVEYEDGLTTTIPLRYRWNILDLKNEAGAVAFRADTFDYGNATKFYAFEWTNPRLGKSIKQFRLQGAHDFRDHKGRQIPSNAIILAAVSVVPKREKSKPQDPPFPQ